MSIIKKALAGAALSVLVGSQAVSFEAVADRLNDRLIGFIRVHLQDAHTAEDLAQEVFLTFFKKTSKGEAGPFENSGHLDGYVLRIAHYKILREFRDCRRKPIPKALEMDPCAPPEPTSVDPEPCLESIYPYIHRGYAAALDAEARGDKVPSHTLSRAKGAAREVVKMFFPVS